MQLSKSDLLLLSNFAAINQSILFRPGQQQGTSSNSQSMIAYAGFEVDFPKEFPLFDLNHFISVYDLVASTGDVEIEFPVNENHLIVRSEKTSQNLRAAPIEVIRVPPANNKPKNDPVISFYLSEDMLAYGKKSAAINTFPNLTFESDGKEIFMVSEDIENPSTEKHRRKLEQTVADDFEFRVVFNVGRLKMLNDDYRVDIYSPNLGRFVSENRDYTFFSALDEDVTLSDE